MKPEELSAEHQAIIDKRAEYAFRHLANKNANKDTWVANAREGLTAELTQENLLENIANYSALNEIDARRSPIEWNAKSHRGR